MCLCCICWFSIIYYARAASSCSSTAGHSKELHTIHMPLIHPEDAVASSLCEQIRQLKRASGPTFGSAKLLYWDIGT